jgi:hypothetical protein
LKTLCFQGLLYSGAMNSHHLFRVFLAVLFEVMACLG